MLYLIDKGVVEIIDNEVLESKRRIVTSLELDFDNSMGDNAGLELNRNEDD